MAIGGGVSWNMKGCVMPWRVDRNTEFNRGKISVAYIDPSSKPWIKPRSASIIREEIIL